MPNSQLHVSASDIRDLFDSSILIIFGCSLVARARYSEIRYHVSSIPNAVIFSPEWTMYETRCPTHPEFASCES
jgi:hypothetical protein